MNEADRVWQSQKVERVKDNSLMISLEPLDTAVPEAHASRDILVT